MQSTTRSAQLLTRIAALEARVRKLERSPAVSASPVPASEKRWLVEGLRPRARTAPRAPRFGGGAVGFVGVVDTPEGGHLEWQGEQSVVRLLEKEWKESAGAFAALGHPMRLELLRALLLGVHDVAQLQRLPGLGTSGQLYHHLRALRSEGWVRLRESQPLHRGSRSCRLRAGDVRRRHRAPPPCR